MIMYSFIYHMHVLYSLSVVFSSGFFGASILVEADEIAVWDDGVEMSMRIWMGESMVYDEDCMESNVICYGEW